MVDLKKCKQLSLLVGIEVQPEVEGVDERQLKIPYAEDRSKKPFFEAKGIRIYHDDFLTINCVEESSIDLIVTSPPYNVDIGYNTYDDRISYPIYLEFTRKWIEEAYRAVRDDGRFCLNIPLDKNKGGQQSIYADIVSIAKEVGWKYHSTIVWNEQAAILRRSPS
jgi:site-specific DNA-methyltransferase (adenine-specific)